MVVWMVVMNRCAVVVFLGVGERISNIVRGKVGHMMGVLVDVNRCRSIFIHVMNRSVIMLVVIIMVNMSLVYGLMNNRLMYDSRLVINFMCHDGLVVDLMCHNGLVIDFMSHYGLVNDFMSYDMCILWRRILCC